MPLAELIQSLENDTAREVRALVASARERAAQLEADAARERAMLAAHAEAQRCATCQTTADARLATAQRAARVRILAARADMLDRVRAAVRAQLPGRTREVADILTAAAQACAGTSTGALRAVDTGVIIDLPGGTQLVATLDALLEREWPRLAAAALARAKEVT